MEIKEWIAREWNVKQAICFGDSAHNGMYAKRYGEYKMEIVWYRLNLIISFAVAVCRN